MNIQRISLLAKTIRLEPLCIEHAPAMARVGLDPELWRLQPAPIATADDMLAYVRQALDDEQRGLSLPFAIIDNATGAVVGSTRYMDIATAHRRLEIGATWLMPAFQRTAANTEAKLLLLTHAFETLDAMRVVFKTEALHEASRRALERLGATQEGVFRKHLLAASGRARDMVYFSILEDEWPAIKTGLKHRLR